METTLLAKYIHFDAVSASVVQNKNKIPEAC